MNCCSVHLTALLSRSKPGFARSKGSSLKEENLANTRYSRHSKSKFHGIGHQFICNAQKIDLPTPMLEF